MKSLVDLVLTLKMKKTLRNDDLVRDQVIFCSEDEEIKEWNITFR